MLNTNFTLNPENNSLFKNAAPGTVSQIHNILAYHYDQILREIKQCSNQETYDEFVTFMEEGDLAALLNEMED